MAKLVRYDMAIEPATLVKQGAELEHKDKLGAFSSSERKR